MRPELTIRFASLGLALLITACVGETPVASGPADDETGPSRVLGLVTAPRHGDVIAGDTATATLEVTGYHERPGYRIDVQVLDDPRAPSSWATIGTTVSARTPDDSGLYAWQLRVAPAREARRRWPAGGVLRLRVVGASAEVLPVLLPDEGDCVTAVPDDPWPAILARCGAPVTDGLVIVSPAPAHAAATVRAPSRDRRDAIATAEQVAYYAAIGAR